MYRASAKSILNIARQRVPKGHKHVSKTFEDCNWLQALEGGIDTSHSTFLHNEKLSDKSRLRTRDGAPRLEVTKNAYGFSHG